MTGKSKKELQAENAEIKKELSDLRISHAQLAEEFKCLKDRNTTNIVCNKCENIFEKLPEVRKPHDDHTSSNQIFRCDHCEREFDEKWKLSAHLRTCKNNKCDVCDKTFKYEDLKKKHMLITHENFKIYCHFFNNEKTCPYNKDCVFLHENSTVCKYGAACERNYCMFKHKKKDEPVENEFDKIFEEVDKTKHSKCDEKKEESEKDVTVANIHEDEIVTVDSVIDNIETNVSEDVVVYEIMEDTVTEYLAFKCKMCDFASARKADLKNHKKTIHHWCFICFSTYACQQNLKDHFSNAHSKNQEDLVLALGKAP